MFIDDYTIHEIVCDYLNQNERLSQTEVIRFNQNTNGCEAIVLSAELGLYFSVDHIGMVHKIMKLALGVKEI